jgi:hypothetical protein
MFLFEYSMFEMWTQLGYVTKKIHICIKHSLISSYILYDILIFILEYLNSKKIV